MSSDDSDDEPLAVIATRNKTNYEVEILPASESRTKSKKKSFSTRKACDVTIELQYKDELSSVTVERPTDVWLYLKDLNPNGPYSCLLCSEWFINKTKIVIHYVINHKKDFCGICRCVAFKIIFKIKKFNLYIGYWVSVSTVIDR